MLPKNIYIALHQNKSYLFECECSPNTSTHSTHTHFSMPDNYMENRHFGMIARLFDTWMKYKDNSFRSTWTQFCAIYSLQYRIRCWAHRLALKQSLYPQSILSLSVCSLCDTIQQNCFARERISGHWIVFDFKHE